MKEIKKMLAMNHEMLMVLEHFQLAKLDYAKNIKIYTSIPVKMDNGETQVFTGFRVHYNNARGPSKGHLQ